MSSGSEPHVMDNLACVRIFKHASEGIQKAPAGQNSIELAVCMVFAGCESGVQLLKIRMADARYEGCNAV